MAGGNAMGVKAIGHLHLSRWLPALELHSHHVVTLALFLLDLHLNCIHVFLSFCLWLMWSLSLISSHLYSITVCRGGHLASHLHARHGHLSVSHAFSYSVYMCSFSDFSSRLKVVTCIWWSGCLTIFHACIWAVAWLVICASALLKENLYMLPTFATISVHFVLGTFHCLGQVIQWLDRNSSGIRQVLLKWVYIHMCLYV